MTPEPRSIEALEEHLYSLELRPAQLRRDPDGATWLGAEWAALVRDDPRLRAVVHRFVEEELELYDSVRGQADAFFTARVIAAASPVEIAGAGLAPRYRSWILAFAYAMALGVAAMVFLPWLKGHGVPSISESFHELIAHELGGEGAGSWLIAGGLTLAAVVVASGIVARGRATPPVR